MSKAINEAVTQAKKQSKDRNFIETIELAINLKNIDLKKPENRIRLEIILPNPSPSKKIKIAVIAEGDLALRAKEVADLIIGKEDLERYTTDKKAAKDLGNEYDFFVAQADIMPIVGRILGPVLGFRGKMPQVVPPTADLEPVIERLQKTIRMRLRQNPVFFAKVGTKDMSAEEISENIESVLKAVEEKLEKGRDNIKSLYVKTTMGSPVKIEL